MPRFISSSPGGQPGYPGAWGQPRPYGVWEEAVEMLCILAHDASQRTHLGPGMQVRYGA